jgi:hypothetical protein
LGRDGSPNRPSLATKSFRLGTGRRTARSAIPTRIGFTSPGKGGGAELFCPHPVILFGNRSKPQAREEQQEWHQPAQFHGAFSGIGWLASLFLRVIELVNQLFQYFAFRLQCVILVETNFRQVFGQSRSQSLGVVTTQSYDGFLSSNSARTIEQAGERFVP